MIPPKDSPLRRRIHKACCEISGLKPKQLQAHERAIEKVVAHAWSREEKR